MNVVPVAALRIGHHLERPRIALQHLQQAVRNPDQHGVVRIARIRAFFAFPIAENLQQIGGFLLAHPVEVRLAEEILKIQDELSIQISRTAWAARSRHEILKCLGRYFVDGDIDRSAAGVDHHETDSRRQLGLSEVRVLILAIQRRRRGFQREDQPPVGIGRVAHQPGFLRRHLHHLLVRILPDRGHRDAPQDVRLRKRRRPDRLKVGHRHFANLGQIIRNHIGDPVCPAVVIEHGPARAARPPLADLHFIVLQVLVVAAIRRILQLRQFALCGVTPRRQLPLGIVQHVAQRLGIRYRLMRPLHPHPHVPLLVQKRKRKPGPRGTEIDRNGDLHGMLLTEVSISEALRAASILDGLLRHGVNLGILRKRPRRVLR